MWKNVIQKQIFKKVNIFKTVLWCGNSCTANFRVNSSTSTAEIVLVGIQCTPNVLPDVHDGICSTPTGKYNTPSEAPDAHDVCSRLDGK